jgi:transposase-like protein
MSADATRAPQVCLCGFESDEPTEYALHERIWPDLGHGRNWRVLTPRQDWADAYTAGATVPALAREHGTTPAVVRRHLRRAGVTLRDDRAGHSGGHNRRTDVTATDVAALFAQGHTWSQVREELGVASSTLQRLAREARQAAAAVPQPPATCTGCGGEGVIDAGDRYEPGFGPVADVHACTDCDGTGYLAEVAS